MPEFSEAPHLIPNPSGRAPLVAEISFATTVGSTVSLTIIDDVTRRTVTFFSGGISHRLPVLGLHPARSYKIDIMTIDAADGSAWATLELTTPPLPSEITSISPKIPQGEIGEPSFTLFIAETSPRFVVACDPFGDVAWIYESPDQVEGLRRLANGNLVLASPEHALEIDMLGKTISKTNRQGPLLDNIAGEPLRLASLYPDHVAVET